MSGLKDVPYLLTEATRFPNTEEAKKLVARKRKPLQQDNKEVLQLLQMVQERLLEIQNYIGEIETKLS